MTCDECGARIPAKVREMVNAHHAETCSLHPSAVMEEDVPAARPAGPDRAFACACGSHEFTVGQWQWATQAYDADRDEWGSSQFAYEGDQVVQVVCTHCEADCTPIAMAAGWDVVHDTSLERHDQREGVAICPPVRILGRNGVARRARFAVGEAGYLRLWRGWTNERHPLLEFTAPLPTLIRMVKELLELLCDRYESDRAAERAARRADPRDPEVRL
jgi:hypothetical protein